jgi:hypothetical protein
VHAGRATGRVAVDAGQPLRVEAATGGGAERHEERRGETQWRGAEAANDRRRLSSHGRIVPARAQPVEIVASIGFVNGARCSRYCEYGWPLFTRWRWR